MAGHEAGHTSISSDEVKNEWIYNSHLLIRLHGVNADKFTLHKLCNLNAAIQDIKSIESVADVRI